MADFELFARDSKNVRIPVVDINGAPVDLTNANITWRFAEWMGAPAILEKIRVPGVDAQIAIETLQGGTFPSQLVVKILRDEVNVPEGIYCHWAQVRYVDAADTIKVGTVSVRSAPTA